MSRTIFLVTDFGLEGPYVGQMKTVLATRAPGIPVIDLLHDAPVFHPAESGYLLAALLPQLPGDAVVVAVVDPGVGGARAALGARVGGRWLVGPDNGLLAPVFGSAPKAEIDVYHLPLPENASATFHGRDLFALAAAAFAVTGSPPRDAAIVSEWVGRDWPGHCHRIIYIDHYGNAMTGQPVATLPPGAAPRLAGQRLARARTFEGVPAGHAFWYANSIGLVELAVNRGSAATRFGLAVGDAITFEVTP